MPRRVRGKDQRREPRGKSWCVHKGGTISKLDA